MEKGERGTEREGVWRVPTHGPAHGTSSVFVCVLFVSEASCLSQAGRGAAETGSLMRHRGRARERRSASDRGRTTGRSSTAANPALFPFHLHNLLSPLAHPLSPSNQLSQHRWSGKSSAVQSFSVCFHTNAENKFTYKPHFLIQQKITKCCHHTHQRNCFSQLHNTAH